MSATWHSDTPPPAHSFGAMGVVRMILRGPPLAVLVFGGLIVLLCVRLLERPAFGSGRPVTPYLTVGVCRASLWILGIRYTKTGMPLTGQGAVVANHSSWLDIFVLNAAKRIYFVSKAEVAGWPGIGWLARATGTVFIQRNRTQAAAQAEVFTNRLKVGHKLLFFPEGTSSDGMRVLPFKSALFSAFFEAELRSSMQIQPATVIYTAPPKCDARFFAWWGEMDFGPHFLSVLAAPRGGTATTQYHSPLAVASFDSRKSLASACEASVRAGWESATVRNIDRS